jgi:hypothetical protein
LNAADNRAWNAFGNIRSNFWGNKKYENRIEIVGCLGVQHVFGTPFPAVPLGFDFPGNMEAFRIYQQ